MKLLVSIHDVMPATLDRCGDILERLRSAGLDPVTLLIVPGTGWTDADLAALRAMVGDGAVLAGHGWRHQVRHVRGLKHRLHSALISRQAGEHLALTRFEILRLMLRNQRWFRRNALPEPALYVPPAWAMGPVPRTLLRRLPFRMFETLAGVYDGKTDRFHSLPMAGFEADTRARATFVRPFNAVNRALGRWSGRPLRLGVHPHDFELELADDLRHWLRRGGQGLDYSALAG